MRIRTDVKLLVSRRTKIVATVGPSSRTAETLEKLIAAGVDVFRLNMSHGSHEGHHEVFACIREVSDRLAFPVAVLADLSGPKIRVGTFPEGRITLRKGEAVTVTTREVPGGPSLIPSQYGHLAEDVQPGSRILLDDGNLEIGVRSVSGSEISCRVVTGGELRDRKGMNLPGVAVSAPSLTAKDRSDAQFALDLGVDFLALSFVRRAADIAALRELVDAARKPAAIVAKIEKPEALENIDEILEASDALMVARGDLGVELPPQAVPAAQDQLIERARAYRKPVIVATQMLESMIDNPRPTRAEVSDVATAVRSGADAVMLSAETAAGRYPVESVRMMNDIARQTEGFLWRQGAFGTLARKPTPDGPPDVEDAISESVAQLSRDLLVRAILVISFQGRSLAVMSSARPAAPIIGICPREHCGWLARLLWGVIPLTVGREELDDPHRLARRTAMKLGLAEAGQTLLVVRGFSHDPQSNTPSVTVVTV